MMNNQLGHIIFDIKKITEADVSLWDTSGKLVLSTSETDGSCREVILGEIRNGLREQKEISKAVILPIRDEGTIISYLVLTGDKLPEMVKMLCVSQLETYYKISSGSMNKEEFIKKLVHQAVSSDELELRAKVFGMALQTDRILYMVQCEEESSKLVENLLEQIYELSSDEFIVELQPGKIIVGRECDTEASLKQINVEAYTLADTIEAELMIKIRVGYGEISTGLSYLRQAYVQADTAVQIGTTFYQDRKVINYKELGVGRLVHGLPKGLGEAFLKEVLDGNAIEQFDEEIMVAVHKFFYNNLNISETARQLYVHRNTLVYRLAKVEKKTGLDIRLFEDALTFKLALMVSEQLKKNNE